MRILHFALLAPGSPQWGLRKALRGAADAYAEFDWHALYRAGRAHEIAPQFLAMAREFRPDFTFMQIQTPDILPGDVLGQLPGFTLSWCGDVRDDTPQWAWDTAPHVSLSCFSNGRDVLNLKRRGFAAEFLNIGFSTDVFTPHGAPHPAPPEIVFMGSNYGQRFPGSPQRAAMVDRLRSRYGSRFGVYGHGWGGAARWVNEEEEAAIYRGCTIAINQNHYNDVRQFSSDRIFRAMGSGAFCLSNDFPGLAQDFMPGVDLATWRCLDDLVRQIDHYLDAPEARQKIAAAGCAHVHANHNWDARVREMMGFAGNSSA